jgi:hypothetical protein
MYKRLDAHVAVCALEGSYLGLNANSDKLRLNKDGSVLIKTNLVQNNKYMLENSTLNVKSSLASCANCELI